MKKAFSLIEVIFVLVILGIVASISSQLIVKVYENYITQRAVYNVSTKTELAINQIVNRLTYSIMDSGIAKDPANSANYKLLTELVSATDGNLTVLEWVGYDHDSFDTGATPYWSGVANYKTATKSAFETPSSNLTNVDTIIKNLSKGNKVSLNSNDYPAVVFQPRSGEDDKVDGECMGLVKTDIAAADTNRSCIYTVSENNATGFDFVDPAKAKTITERYQLAWSAYALVPEENNTTGLSDLTLHYNYQPWLGEHYNDANTSVSTLISNISVFKFTQSGGVIQLKLCATENIGQDYNISTCKEKAIIR